MMNWSIIQTAGSSYLFFLNTHATELAKTGVTRLLLWNEYMQKHPDGYGYSQYCYHLKQHHKRGTPCTWNTNLVM